MWSEDIWYKEPSHQMEYQREIPTYEPEEYDLKPFNKH